jgi:photosystem II stability/assembly factor-like uncharacterized protein
MKMKRLFSGLALVILTIADLFPQSNQSHFVDSVFKGLKLRNIGPAFMSGRIADIAIHPEKNSTWYVAVGSGGVWKTENSGTTWDPVFDDQKSYSIGCISIDQNNPNIIWAGTGENVGGRHVAYGDGIYKSDDGGKSWTNMGLKESQHISKIIIHPGNSDIVWVAVQGPLWKDGGDRGLYKTSDRGKTWKKTLGDDKWTGVTDLVIDPGNPGTLYAATWERHRNVAAYVGGGPGSGIYRSEDGGESWKKLTEGLPASDIGKIGLAISPQKTDVIYAAIELNRRSGGVYRSANRGASWEKMSDAVSGATGPHYYQELYASPHKFDRIYLVDVRMQVSEDGGITFTVMSEEHKHSDNHAIAFRKDDPEYLLVGTDGGLYESYDLAKNWRFINNLPVTQFYKVAVDDAAPFYNIYGGTQDNNTQGGPSRTDNRHGISNSDWCIVLFADGHQPATEPGNPGIIYSEAQEGYLYRIDRTTGELVFIQPQPDTGEGFERFNWDAPILVSPHSPTRLYYASQRVWKSDNRGDSWVSISDDLTRNQERLTLPIDGRTWSWDSPWDIYAMSTYNTITSLAESPQKEGLIYAGTDDGLIQITEDGGKNWRKIELSSLPGVPGTAFVNDIKADLFDENTLYIAVDNHKFGDLSPYLLKSSDRGKSWRSIKGNIPDRTLVWRIVQDHINPELLFAATEFGIYFTVDAGEKWVRLSGDVPTISFRDLAIQRRENDLVAASFGRGIFIFDDYSVLRHVTDSQLKQEATLFPTRNAWWYIERMALGMESKGSQGASYFTAPNPPFGAVFTYYLSKDYKSAKEIRQEKEKKAKKEHIGITFPGWDEVENERREENPFILLTVKDKDGNVVRTLEGPAKAGFHRVAWDLRYPAKRVINVDNKKESSDPEIDPRGFLSAPGVYTVSLLKKINGKVTSLSDPVEFEVKRLHTGALEGSSPEQTVAFYRKLEDLQKELSAASLSLKKTTSRVEAMQQALKQSENNPGKIDHELHLLRQRLYDLDQKLNGNFSKNEIGEKNSPTVNDRLQAALSAVINSTYGPTPVATRSYEIAMDNFVEIKTELNNILTIVIPNLEKRLLGAGAPYVR